MGLFENQFLLHQRNPFYSKILFYKRFINDIFLIIDCTLDELMGFHEYLNSCNEHLKFTLEYDKHCISFLDIQVYKDGMTTDRNTILHGDSFHSRPLVKSLMISQFNCVRRICSDNISYSKQAADLTKRFLNRGMVLIRLKNVLIR